MVVSKSKRKVGRPAKKSSAKLGKLKAKKERKKELHSETVHGVWGVLLVMFAVFFTLAGFGYAGSLGESLYTFLYNLFGIGYALLPISLLLWAFIFFKSAEQKIGKVRAAGSFAFFVSALALIESIFTTAGGVVGGLLANPLVAIIATPATIIVLLSLILVSLLIVFDAHPSVLVPGRKKKKEAEEKIQRELTEDDVKIKMPKSMQEADKKSDAKTSDTQSSTPKEKKPLFSFGTDKKDEEDIAITNTSFTLDGEYTPPPIKLLKKNKGRPETGDLKANLNIIRRTLQNFGINVEMDEVSVGPTVTRYALKPAEGVRLNKILSLQSNLELALAASPVRIEAPIPGKALVGIEVPNMSRTTLGLGSIFSTSEFKTSTDPLLVALGTDISGTPHFTDISKMPHMLIAGTTGAGKSVTIHNLIVSLLYRLGPDKLRLVMVDPKRVELTLYNGIPHLLTPVITDPKKAILALKWLAKEMDRRYDILEAHSVRDITSYHKNIVASGKMEKGENGEEKEPDPMPYMIAFLDELSDLMQAYPRELEAAIVRLAQMSRAVGIHLILATQRPDVRTITGLIKANIPSRLALKVSSQIDSRTILDMGGAEKLLGAGDMLFMSGKMSGSPMRIQAPYVTEGEVKAVVKYLVKSYEGELGDEIQLTEANDPTIFDSAVFDDDEAGDELYEDAKRTVIEAGKGSTSFLQRKLRVGYARAARLMDLLEDKGIVGPQDGAKAREVLVGADEAIQAEEEE